MYMYVIQCKKKYVLKIELTNGRHHGTVTLDSNFACA